MLHRLVTADPRIDIIYGAYVTDLLCDSLAVVPAVYGVAYTRARATHEQCADLVVDCSGRYSAIGRWVRRCGYGTVTEETAGGPVAYCSATGTLPGPPPWHMLYVTAATPPQGLCAIVLDPGAARPRVLVSGFAYAGHTPPTEPAGLAAYARQVLDAQADRDVREALAAWAPDSEVRHYKVPCSLRRRFHDLPLGLVPVGDVVASLNPVHGQGVAGACLAVRSLDLALAAYPHNLRAMGRRYMRLMEPGVAQAWELVVSHDAEVAGDAGAGSGGWRGWLLRLYTVGLGRCMHVPAVARRWLPVVHLCASPWALLHPLLLLYAFLGYCGVVDGRHTADGKGRG